MALEITWDDDEDTWVKVGDRDLPARFALVYRPAKGADEPAWTVEFHVQDGVPQCRHVGLSSTVNGREIRSADLRALRIEDLLEGASANVAARRVVDDDGSARMVRDLGSWRDVTRAVRGARRNARRKVTDEVLREVARVYRENVGDNPTAAVARHLGESDQPVPDRTARLYVRRARDAGFLGQSIPGKAGER